MLVGQEVDEKIPANKKREKKDTATSEPVLKKPAAAPAAVDPSVEDETLVLRKPAAKLAGKPAARSTRAVHAPPAAKKKAAPPAALGTAANVGEAWAPLPSFCPFSSDEE